MNKNVMGDFRPFGAHLYEETKQDTGLKRTRFKADINYLMERQKGKCASKNCVKYNGKKQSVHSISNLDHIIPIKLWELMKKKGDVNMRSNIQLLCPNCHARKTAEDRKRIAKYQEKNQDTSESQKSEPTVQDLLGNLKNNWKI